MWEWFATIVGLSFGLLYHGVSFKANVEVESLMTKFRIFISSVQREFADERRMLAVCHRDYSDNGSVQIMLFSDRLEILNPGMLPKGWTAERLLRTHDSKARNLTIAQALNWAGYVEKSGNGTESIVRRCLEVGLPKPEYHPDNVDFKAVIWRNPGRLGPVGTQLGRSQDSVGALSRGTKSGHQVKALSPEGKSVETVFERVAAGCAIPCSALELMRKEGRTDRTKFKKSVLDILLSDGILEYTIPDKPRSRLQKYRLTEKGRAVLRKPQG